jgi:hypothetical protein
MGTRLKKDDAAKLTIGDGSLVKRSRQIQWELIKRAVDKIICSPGVQKDT